MTTVLQFCVQLRFHIKKTKEDSSNDNSFTFCVQLQFHIKNRKHQKHTARFARNVIEFSKTGFF